MFNLKPTSGVDTTGLEKDKTLNTLESLSINIKFQMDDMAIGDDGNPKLVEVVGHSDCNCWGLTADSSGLLFGKKCNQD